MQCREFYPRCADLTLTIARAASDDRAGDFCARGGRMAALAMGLPGGVASSPGLVFSLVSVFSGL